MLARPRVKSEHCIGIFKGRLPFFRSIRLKLGNRKHVHRIIDHVRAGVILHNMLINDDYEDEWLAEDDCLADDLEQEEVLTGLGGANTPDYTRRDELYYYLSELEDTPIN